MTISISLGDGTSSGFGRRLVTRAVLLAGVGLIAFSAFVPGRVAAYTHMARGTNAYLDTYDRC